MVELSAEQIAQRAFDLGLIDDRQLQEIWGHIGSRRLSSQQFQQLLLRRKLLTNYQVERLLRGERSGFFYGDFKVLYLVGTGTFARVYRAAHKESGQIVAVKVLRRRFIDDADPAERDRFYREGLMGASLRHPNIVPIHEVVAKGDAHFLVMDFVEGRNLRELVKIRGKLDPSEATSLMIDATNGLSYAADRGICHRDLKLSNILISSRGEGKLVDFGLAAVDDNASDEALAGIANPRTIDYAGLERSTGVRKNDQRSDIYFLGCIYYHILTGKSPLQETRDRTQRLSKTRFQSVVPIYEVEPPVPRCLVPVVTKSMELNPTFRYQTPGEMLVDLRVAAKKLSEPEPEADGVPAVKTPAASDASQPSLMFVEANVELQNIFRERLKRSGYRVLVTQDPERALGRFQENPAAADCVIFSTGALGESALEAFNTFSASDTTARIPAVLLLGEKQHRWMDKAKLSEHRVAIGMPVKLKQLRALLARLVPRDADSA